LAGAIGSIHAAEWAVEATMLRFIFVLFAALCLSACIPDDPNLDKLVKGETDLLKEDNAHAELMADKRAEAAAKCATAPNVDGCMLGLVALELAAGKAASGVPKRSMPAYTPPPTALQQIGGFVRDVTPLANVVTSAAVAIDGTRERERTARHNEAVNAAREAAIVQEVALAGTNAVRAATSQPPTYHVSDGGIVNSGTITQYGDDATGGDRTDVGGNQGDTYGDDATGGDRTDNRGIIGDNNDQRGDDSPGPIDDHSDPGDDCTGSDCGDDLPPPAGE
jgi:hypothetical protein